MHYPRQLTLGVDITNGFLLACEKSLSELHDAFDLKHHKLSKLVEGFLKAEIDNAQEALADMQVQYLYSAYTVLHHTLYPHAQYTIHCSH
jgi:hypothetical protein